MIETRVTTRLTETREWQWDVPSEWEQSGLELAPIVSTLRLTARYWLRKRGLPHGFDQVETVAYRHRYAEDDTNAPLSSLEDNPVVENGDGELVRLAARVTVHLAGSTEDRATHPSEVIYSAAAARWDLPAKRALVASEIPAVRLHAERGTETLSSFGQSMIGEQVPPEDQGGSQQCGVAYTPRGTSLRASCELAWGHQGDHAEEGDLLGRTAEFAQALRAVFGEHVRGHEAITPQMVTEQLSHVLDSGLSLGEDVSKARGWIGGEWITALHDVFGGGYGITPERVRRELVRASDARPGEETPEPGPRSHPYDCPCGEHK